MGDYFDQQEDSVHDQPNLESSLIFVTDMLGNADDFRPNDRYIQKIYIDKKLVDDKNSNKPKIKEFMLTIFRDDMPNESSLAQQLALTLNTAIHNNSFDSDNLSFLGIGYDTKKMRTEFPDITLIGTHPLDRYSVLFLNRNNTLIPLVYFTRGPNYIREDTPGSEYIDFSHYIGVMPDYTQLSENEQQALTNLLLKYSQTGFPALTELSDDTNTRYLNPIENDGKFSPTLEFYRADPRAWKIRNELAEIAVLIEYSFEIRNEKARIISIIDQKSTKIYSLLAEEGIDLETYTFTKALDNYKPFNTTVETAWNVLNSMFDISNLKANHTDLRTGKLSNNKDQSDSENEMNDYEEPGFEIRKMSNFSDLEIKILMAQSIINIMFDRLDINDEEVREIKAKLDLK